MNRAFNLAYFILGDRTTSVYLAMAAMDKLKTASTIQDRRFLYVPTGRSAYPAARAKVSLSHLHLLQRLIYIESEPFERLIEGQEESLRQSDMITRFIKHLVMLTTKHNSFYVALGLCRLLYNYTTSETIEIYNFVVQDPDRGRDDYYYRSRKSHLLHELKERFGGLLKTQRGHRGEERFKPQEDSGRYAGLARACLSHFMPWESSCVLPAGIDPTKDIVPLLRFQGKDPDEEHEIEVNRMHTLLHPDCLERVAATLGLAPPASRLELPHFLISGDGAGPPDHRLKPQALSRGELDAIRRYLEKNAARRRDSAKRFLSVLVDGDEQACFEAGRASSIQISVGEDSEFIQVRSIEAEEEIPLAIHPLTYGGGVTAPTKSSVTLGAGQKLSFAVQPLDSTVGEKACALVRVDYHETNAARLASSLLGRFKAGLSGGIGAEQPGSFNHLRFALGALVIAICVAGLFIYLHSRQSPPDRQLIAERTEIGESSNQPGAPSPSPSTQAQPTPQAQRDTQHPPGSAAQRGQRRQKQLPPDSSGTEPGATRGQPAGPPSTLLLSVKRVYVDQLGEEPLSRQVQEALAKYLQSSGRFVLAESRNEADAVFKGSARRVAKGGERVTVSLRLVNVKGQVVWSTASGGRAKVYSGYPDDVTDRVIKDLLADIQRLEGKR